MGTYQISPKSSQERSEITRNVYITLFSSPIFPGSVASYKKVTKATRWFLFSCAVAPFITRQNSLRVTGDNAAFRNLVVPQILSAKLQRETCGLKSQWIPFSHFNDLGNSTKELRIWHSEHSTRWLHFLKEKTSKLAQVYVVLLSLSLMLAKETKHFDRLLCVTLLWCDFRWEVLVADDCLICEFLTCFHTNTGA